MACVVLLSIKNVFIVIKHNSKIDEIYLCLKIVEAYS